MLQPPDLAGQGVAHSVVPGRADAFQWPVLQAGAAGGLQCWAGYQMAIAAAAAGAGVHLGPGDGAALAARVEDSDGDWDSRGLGEDVESR
jgi:hypothetical protein